VHVVAGTPTAYGRSVGGSCCSVLKRRALGSLPRFRLAECYGIARGGPTRCQGSPAVTHWSPRSIGSTGFRRSVPSRPSEKTNVSPGGPNSGSTEVMRLPLIVYVPGGPGGASTATG